METWTPPGCFSKGLLFSALFLALELPQGSQAALHIEMIPEQPQKNQDLLLSLHGVPSTAQDFIWYLGEEASGGTRLFSYIPGLPRPQRDGSAMGQRDIVGFPNGSMLLRNAQPSDSGTYQVAATMNPAWTMKAKINVHVAGIQPQRSQK
ncbi:carcinoembryonic antigen-related cell adhesion molecule 19 isoform X3 [Mus musculus]|uniref:carcinoembryonic antigen-related cell adhesion molecule 19 isoform X3 n=1 Tax=Mus musculus TaxID=10090 RepID=UPI0003D743E2|nr:carcinoembryonic antigen-related cell adhesion molecule 19 isoform X3 [Mus musculus]|eukprot:XP_006540129.1 PREDICTED: carcinoembryonic antigen-related cell adhesion molecule 19 isoform X3 [Mus musculus]